MHFVACTYYAVAWTIRYGALDAESWFGGKSLVLLPSSDTPSDPWYALAIEFGLDL